MIGTETVTVIIGIMSMTSTTAITTISMNAKTVAGMNIGKSGIAPT